MELSYSLDIINEVAGQFLSAFPAARVVAFHGEMGAGKTTFIKALCSQLGSGDLVSSPTFSIINEYSLPQGTGVYHLDLYRLKSSAEAYAAGVAECFESGNYCFVEWPELAPELLPTGTLHCYITILSDKERKMRINL